MHHQQKKRLYIVLAVAGGCVLLLVGYALLIRLMGFGLPCTIHLLTGMDCAACGLSRAAAALLSLDFISAFTYNAVWPLYLGYALFAGISLAVGYIKDGNPFRWPRPLWVNFAVLGAVLAYGILRNRI